MAKATKHTFTTIAVAAGIALGGAAIAAGNASVSDSNQQADTQSSALQYDDSNTNNNIAGNSASDQAATDTRTMGAGPASDTDRSDASLQGTNEMGAGPSADSGLDSDLGTYREPRIDRN